MLTFKFSGAEIISAVAGRVEALELEIKTEALAEHEDYVREGETPPHLSTLTLREERRNRPRIAILQFVVAGVDSKKEYELSLQECLLFGLVRGGSNSTVATRVLLEL